MSRRKRQSKSARRIIVRERTKKRKNSNKNLRLFDYAQYHSININYASLLYRERLKEEAKRLKREIVEGTRAREEEARRNERKEKLV